MLSLDQEPRRRHDQQHVPDEREQHFVGILLGLAETAAGDVKPPRLRLLPARTRLGLERLSRPRLPVLPRPPIRLGLALSRRLPLQ